MTTDITLETVHNELTALRSEMKALAKIVRKIRAHQEDPEGLKVKARSANNGFNKPINVSAELAKFIGISEKETISRSEVTRKISAYVSENNLKHPENGRVIVMDDKLKKLLNPPDGLQVTYLNLQRYLGPHYKAVEGTSSEPPKSPKVTKTKVTKKA